MQPQKLRSKASASSTAQTGAVWLARHLSSAQLQKCNHFIEVSIYSLDYPEGVMDKRDKYSPLLPRLHEGGILNVRGVVTSDCEQAWLATSVDRPDNPSRSQLGRQCWDAGTSVALTALSCSVDEVSSLQLFLRLLQSSLLQSLRPAICLYLNWTSRRLQPRDRVPAPITGPGLFRSPGDRDQQSCHINRVWGLEQLWSQVWCDSPEIPVPGAWGTRIRISRPGEAMWWFSCQTGLQSETMSQKAKMKFF